MDWKDVAAAIGKSAPIIGGILGGPPGVAIGSVANIVASALGVNATPEEVSTALAINPEAAVKLKQIEKERQVELLGIHAQVTNAQIAAQSMEIESVNATMRAEAAADHWPTYTWRPFIGFMFGLYIASLFILPPFGVAPVILSTDITLAVGGILGVASWFRGKAQSDPRIPTDNRG